jgi:type IV secretory pathway TrbD component
MSEPERLPAPPVGEEIHMPAPSVLPLINAAGLALAIVSITLTWWLVGVGLVIFFATAIRWIADTRREISELPLEHEAH